jgi:hypothetical protein
MTELLDFLFTFLKRVIIYNSRKGSKKKPQYAAKRVRSPDISKRYTACSTLIFRGNYIISPKFVVGFKLKP